MSDFCYGDEINTLCNNEFKYEDSMIIKPPDKNTSKLAHKYIFIDTADYSMKDDSMVEFTIDFDETIKDIVEIELMSCHLPLIPVPSNEAIVNKKYLLLFVDNLDLGNYKKISKNQSIKKCFARLPITTNSANTFFGRIKNFTNVYHFKPILQKLNKLSIRITDRLNNTYKIPEGDSIQLTFGITYQTMPDLFD